MCHVIQKCIVKVQVQVGHSGSKIRNLDIVRVNLKEKNCPQDKSNLVNFAEGKYIYLPF
jgi:purine-nucleoside phosphorylase